MSTPAPAPAVLPESLRQELRSLVRGSLEQALTDLVAQARADLQEEWRSFFMQEMGLLPGTPEARVRLLHCGAGARDAASPASGTDSSPPHRVAAAAVVPFSRTCLAGVECCAPRSALCGRGSTSELGSDCTPGVSGLSQPAESGPARPLSFINQPLHRASLVSWEQFTVRSANTRSAFFFVHHPVFDYFICLALILNAVSIGWQVEYAATHPNERVPVAFQVAEAIFCFVFFAELLMRMYVWQGQFFSAGRWKWNAFDTAVVLLQLVDVILEWAMSGNEGPAISAHSKAPRQIMSLLRFFRLTRILRLLRLVRFVQELQKLVFLIIGSLHSFWWTLVLLLLMTYISGVFLTQLVSDHSRLHPEQDNADMEDLQTYYGSIGDSILSLFAATSGGIDWTDLLFPLMQTIDIGPILALFFIMYVAFSILVVMNLVTGVFVDGAKRLSKEERERDVRSLLRRVFEKTTSERCVGDDDRLITWQEFSAQLESAHMQELFTLLDMDRSEARILFQLLDRDGSNSLTAKEFIHGAQRLHGHAKKLDVAALHQESRTNNSCLSAYIGSIERMERRLDRLLAKVSSLEQAVQKK